MMETTVEHLYIFILVFTFLFTSLFHKWYSNRKLPPGPITLPIVGYLPLLDVEGYKTFSKLHEKYGNIFSLKLGTKLVVVLGDKKAMKECFISQAEIFAGRSSEFSVAGFFFNKKSLFVTDGELSILHRKFILRTFKDLGLGTTQFETKLQDEVEKLISCIKNENGLDFDAGQLTFSINANVIFDLTIGKRFKYDDSKLKDLKIIAQTFTTTISQTAILEYLPFLRKFPLKWMSLKSFSESKRDSTQYFEEISDEHEKTLDEANIRDLIDTYLIYMKDKPDDEKFSRDYMIENMKLMFLGGVETSQAFLQWSFNLMAKNTDVQSRVREEIKDVVGTNRFVSFSDRPNMPYTQATICEIHRIASVVPLTFIHCNTKKTTVFGYEIPRRTRIIANIWHLHNDSTVWNEPEKFDPNRFLNEDGKLNEMKTHIFPFSDGRRSCLGENLSNRVSFFIFCAILQHFDLQPAQNNHETITITPGITRNLSSCFIRFKPL